MNIKLAKKSDNKSVSSLFKALDIEAYKASDIKEINKHIKNKECYIIEGDNKILAAMILELEDMCYEIVTLTSKIKDGGRKLVEFAINKCKEDKIPKLWCWSLKRYNAKGFYEKMGFEERHLLIKQGFGEDCYFFGKLIDNK